MFAGFGRRTILNITILIEEIPVGTLDIDISFVIGLVNAPHIGTQIFGRWCGVFL